jgi:hypothetical protein
MTYYIVIYQTVIMEQILLCVKTQQLEEVVNNER